MAFMASTSFPEYLSASLACISDVTSWGCKKKRTRHVSFNARTRTREGETNQVQHDLAEEHVLERLESSSVVRC